MKQKEDRKALGQRDSDCSQCFYSWKTIWGGDDHPLWACDYIGIENRRRPCKAGSGCTVFKPKRGNRQYTAGWFYEGRRDDD